MATLLEKCGNLKTPGDKRAALRSRTCSGPTFSSSILPTGIGVIIGFTPAGKKQRVAMAGPYGERTDFLAKMLLDVK
ncbi:hypothetical protein [Paraburkholderia sp. RL17-381-BIF-C]|uniref:hypothetical protein n=1 Tax=Paraburkholderia sp. RL17-381-BIF-C TaxID=3031635 RepID=UPI0038B83CAB